MKLGLGSVQFGSDYGIANPGGCTPLPEVKRILKAAALGGIEIIDTAPSYVKAEDALGAAFERGHSFRLVTKTPAYDGRAITAQDAVSLDRTFRQSLARLGADRVYGLLVHHSDDLLAADGERLFAALTEIRARGLVQKIGVSVYGAKDIDAILRRFSIDVVQAPVSVLDQRLIASGHLKALKQSGVEVHARSLFLQGALLMRPDMLPEHLAGLRSTLERFNLFVTRYGGVAVHAALTFAASVQEIDVAILGVNNVHQLEEACRWRQVGIPPAELLDFALCDDELLDPRRWPKKTDATSRVS